ncbi:MAG: hypothetical protein ACOYNC_15685 [Bacteroidales bacterium]
MKILAIEKNVRKIDPENETTILSEEAIFLYELFHDEIVREFYFNENHEAILVLEYTSIAACEELLHELPLVKREFTRFQLMELRPYTGFERIFIQNS